MRNVSEDVDRDALNNEVYRTVAFDVFFLDIQIRNHAWFFQVVVDDGQDD